MKYWEYTDEELREKQMYPLLPLQLFNLRKDLEKASKKEDLESLKTLSYQARELAARLAYQSKQLFEDDEIVGEDFHKMLLAIQNLIEYLNRNYLRDEKLEDEVIRMTKTLYDPEVEKRGIKQGIEQGIEQGKIDIARRMLIKGKDIEEIIELTGLTKEMILELKSESNL